MNWIHLFLEFFSSLFLSLARLVLIIPHIYSICHLVTLNCQVLAENVHFQPFKSTITWSVWLSVAWDYIYRVRWFYQDYRLLVTIMKMSGFIQISLTLSWHFPATWNSIMFPGVCIGGLMDRRQAAVKPEASSRWCHLLEDGISLQIIYVIIYVLIHRHSSDGDSHQNKHPSNASSLHMELTIQHNAHGSLCSTS